jgi:hypothetical protein
MEEKEKIALCQATIALKDCAIPAEIKCPACFLKCGYKNVNGENAAVFAAKRYLAEQGVRRTPEYSVCATYQEGDRIVRNGIELVCVLVDTPVKMLSFVPASKPIGTT